jgi:predicted HAD superfamily Cof-like phosphohydrolase
LKLKPPVVPGAFSFSNDRQTNIFTDDNFLNMSKHLFPEPSPLNDVAEFHRTFNLPVLDTPAIPGPDRCALRVNLLQEELDELKQAIEEKDITGVADALSDIQYVLSGAILEFGLGPKFKELFEEVQRSNMSKVCPDYVTAEETVKFYRDKDGTQGFIKESEAGFLVYRESDKKVLKSLKYSPADLESILSEQ